METTSGISTDGRANGGSLSMKSVSQTASQKSEGQLRGGSEWTILLDPPNGIGKSKARAVSSPGPRNTKRKLASGSSPVRTVRMTLASVEICHPPWFQKYISRIRPSSSGSAAFGATDQFTTKHSRFGSSPRTVPPSQSDRTSPSLTSNNNYVYTALANAFEHNRISHANANGTGIPAHIQTVSPTSGSSIHDKPDARHSSPQLAGRHEPSHARKKLRHKRPPHVPLLAPLSKLTAVASEELNKRSRRAPKDAILVKVTREELDRLLETKVLRPGRIGNEETYVSYELNSDWIRSNVRFLGTQTDVRTEGVDDTYMTMLMKAAFMEEEEEEEPNGSSGDAKVDPQKHLFAVPSLKRVSTYITARPTKFQRFEDTMLSNFGPGKVSRGSGPKPRAHRYINGASDRRPSDTNGALDEAETESEESTLEEETSREAEAQILRMEEEEAEEEEEEVPVVDVSVINRQESEEQGTTSDVVMVTPAVDDATMEAWAAALHRLAKGKQTVDSEGLQNLSTILDKIDQFSATITVDAMKRTNLLDSLENLSSLRIDDIPYDDKHKLRRRAKALLKLYE